MLRKLIRGLVVGGLIAANGILFAKPAHATDQWQKCQWQMGVHGCYQGCTGAVFMNCGTEECEPAHGCP